MSITPHELNALRSNVQQALNRNTDQLRLIPAAVIKLLQLTTDENTNIGDLSKVIDTEPSLAMQILKTINSSHYNVSQPINSIRQAIAMLGYANIRDIAIRQLFYSQLHGGQASKYFDSSFFWQHCLFVASLSKAIAIKLDYPHSDLIYTAGLLHDIGKLVLENHGKLSYSEFIATYVENGYSLLTSELNFYGVTHQQVGYLLCNDWQLPDIITAVVAYHHATDIDEMLSEKYVQEIAIVSFANYLAWIHGIGSFAANMPLNLPSIVFEYIALQKLDLESLLVQVDQDMQEIGVFYGIEFPGTKQLRANLVHSSIALSRSSPSGPDSAEPQAAEESINFLSSLTIPHQSLDPDTFVPQTLKAIGDIFKLDRIYMLSMTAKQRCLVAKYYFPDSLQGDNAELTPIKIDSLSGDLLTCLRTQQASIISDRYNRNHKLLKEVGVSEFVSVPILRNNRLSAVLYADNKLSRRAIPADILNKITPIANELGSALHNAKRFEQERSKAKIDPLTGLSNKRMLTDYLQCLFEDGQKTPVKMALGFLDIDHFKSLNDDCGHQRGDTALRIVAHILQELSRSGDFVGRYGGEEFLFVLLDCTAAGAFQYAERVRADIEAKGHVLKHRFNGHVITASIGLAMYQPTYTNYQDWIAAADKAMYQAKKTAEIR
nr:HDOD domain-containing protein [Methylomarinum sp. Ch1-1]MDP4523048.1 HDOD domain-containing protein [Methylomarinum sp. Ch1-1]